MAENWTLVYRSKSGLPLLVVEDHVDAERFTERYNKALAEEIRKLFPAEEPIDHWMWKEGRARTRLVAVATAAMGLPDLTEMNELAKART